MKSPQMKKLNSFEEAESSGFKPKFESYLKSLNRRPLIKECMMKCMELSKQSMGMDA